MVCEMRKLLEAADRMVICEEDLDPLAPIGGEDTVEV